jgi:hypothetical protein
VIFDPKGEEELSFAWIIGNTTNNQYKALALWKCVWIMKDKGIKQLIVVGHSMIAIHHMVFKSLLKDPHLCSLVL